MIRLSGVVITYNEARNVERCLASLRQVCDELVVVDSGSTDRTRELAEACGARVVVRPFDGFTAQKDFAVQQAAHDHVLSLRRRVDANGAAGVGVLGRVREQVGDGLREAERIGLQVTDELCLVERPGAHGRDGTEVVAVCEPCRRCSSG